MAKKIADLTELTSPADTDILIIEDVSASETKKIQFGNLHSQTGIRQIVQTLKTDTASATAIKAWTDIWTFDSITPTLAGSDILIFGEVVCGFNGGEETSLRLLVSVGGGSYSVLPYVGDAAGNREQSMVPASIYGATSFAYKHTPTYTLGQALTYKLQFYCNGSNGHGYFYINRTEADINTNNHSRWASTINLIEVA